MSVIVPRTCTEVSDTDHNQKNASRPLDDFRSKSAYVLLGDPGSGKTTAFEEESEDVADALCIPARKFIRLSVESHPEWRGKTLFIDGLDEARVGKTDVLTPFDEIWSKLDELGKPWFRLSCREADWLGDNDREHLASVAPDGAITVLRLDPLTDDDILAILDAQPGVNDAREFVAKARERGVDGLLTNPQSLELLVKAVADGGWPESRLDTFERACRQMVREPNKTHQAARRGMRFPSPDQLLNVAGRLCTVQLIADINGYTLGPDESDRDYPSPEECGGGIEYDVHRAALASYLFKAESDDTRLAPIHRHIAEFLGARHLAQLIDKGLPTQRVLALITGADGGVVTEMRGLSAWLAAQCPRARMALIERDPIGVGLYGDIRQFSHDEKRALLNTLEHVGGRLGSELSSQNWTTAFGPLATADMEPALREILTDPARDEQHQILAVFVLRILKVGTPLSSLSELLLAIVYDDKRTPSVKALSLDAFLHTYPDSQGKTDTLERLLADIQAGRVTDPDDELLGTLLTSLYPQDLPASRVWDYLSEPGDSNLIGRYVWFWNRCLLEQSSDEDVCELLDGLLCPPSGLRSALEMAALALEDLSLKLLARGLNAYGDRISTKQLYDWLGVGLPMTQYKFGEEARNVQAWLEQRPAIQKAILTEGIRRYAESDDERYMYEVEQRLYRANPPSDFGAWCLEQARAVTDSQVAEYFIAFASRTGLPLESQLEKVRGHRDLQNCISRMITRRDRYEAEHQERQRRQQSYTEERKRREKQWLAHIRSNKAALRENRASLVLLHELAITYLDSYPSIGPEALRQKLGDDPALLDAALRGLRGVVDRDDVPDSKKIFDLYKKNCQHYLSLPLLVSLVKIERATPVDLSQWDDSRLCTALAFYFCTPFPGDKPQWYRHLLAKRPELVADVQVQYARVALRSGQEVVNGLRELAYDREHLRVAQHASLPLLRAFPVRCRVNQLSHLDNLLWAAIQHADRSSLKELIERKLSRPSMNTMQRVHWLAAGLVVLPALYRERLGDFVRHRKSRIEHVVTFFCDRTSYHHLEVPVELGIPVVKFLSCLIGSYSEPNPRLEEGPVTSLMKGSQLVHAFVRHLATSPAKEASDALASLHADPALERWHDELSRAQDSQRIIRRDAEYRHPTIEQVRETLNGGTPANPGDLAALLVDRLHEIARRIRTGNTDDWRQYWNEDSHGRPTEPKPENSCRDALLSDLRQYLPPGIDAQPEGQYANDKRADIRVAYRDFQVPIEIKKSDHRDLWSAMKNQLIAQYTRDPDSSGYGIYLVFWFGRETCKPGVDGRPKNASELKKKLRKTLSPDEARRISVCVIDVTRP